jgi:hypothetical protein
MLMMRPRHGLLKVEFISYDHQILINNLDAAIVCLSYL